MNKRIFWTGLSMQILNLVGIAAFFAIPYMKGVSVSNIIAIGVYGIFNLASFGMLLTGAFMRE